MGRFWSGAPHKLAVRQWLEVEQQRSWRSCSLTGCLPHIVSRPLHAVSPQALVELPQNMAAKCSSEINSAPKAAASTLMTQL